MTQSGENLVTDLIEEQYKTLKDEIGTIIGSCKNLLELTAIIKMKKQNVISKEYMHKINQINKILTITYNELLTFKENSK